METALAFFSSDARTLYKADIYRALTLPTGSILHFRYGNQYVSTEISTNPEDLKNESAVIFFSAGNDLTVPKEKREIKHISVRNVRVVNTHIDDDQENLLHFYLELRDFVNYGIIDEEENKAFFVRRVNVEKREDNSWAERVRAVTPYFPDQLFFRLKAIRKEREVISPKYDSASNEGYFILDDESIYNVDIAIEDNSDGDSTLHVETTGESFDLHIPEKFSLGALRDFQTFRLTTKNLSLQETYGFIRIYSNATPLFDVIVPVRVRRSRFKSLKFAVFSALAALGVMLGTLATKDFNQVNFSVLKFILAILSLALIGAAAGFLYREFNKK